MKLQSERYPDLSWEIQIYFNLLMLQFIEDCCIFWGDGQGFGLIGFRSLVGIFEKLDFQRLQCTMLDVSLVANQLDGVVEKLIV